MKQFDQDVGKHYTPEQESRTAALTRELKSFVCTVAAPIILRLCVHNSLRQ